MTMLTGRQAANIQTLIDQFSGTTGLTTFPASAIPANSVSLAEVLREMYDQMEKSIKTATAVIANGTTTLFTVTGGPIIIDFIGAVCVTANDGTATTLKYSCDGTDGSAVDISAASASLASAAAGTILNITGTVANPTVIAANGTAIAQAGKILCPAGIITCTAATGPTTGTWYHFLRYRPLTRGVVVS